MSEPENDPRGREQILLERAEATAALGSWQWAPADGELQWSANLFRIFGLEPGTIVPTVELALDMVDPSDRERVAEALRQAAEGKGLPPLELRIARPDGSTRHLRVVATAIEDESGAARLVGSVHDFTEELRAMREVAAYTAVSHTLRDWESLETAGPALLRGIARALEFDSGVLWVPQGDVLSAHLFWHEPALDLEHFEEVTRRTHYPRGVGVPGQVWETGAIVKLAGAPEDANRKRLRAAVEAGLSAALGLPVLDGEEVLAVLEFCCREPHELTDRLLESLTGISHQIGQFLSRRRGELRAKPLSERELEVLGLAAAGLSTPEIAKQLMIGSSTVKTHFEHIHEKLGVSKRAEAVATALRQGLIR